MTSQKKILPVGGGGKAPPADGPVLPEEVKARVGTPKDLKQTLKALIDEASEKGYDVRIMQLEDEEKSLAWVKEVKAALASEQWDGFIIGNGIRGTPRLTVCFEQLVGIGREIAPNAPMGFNTHPMNILKTIERINGFIKDVLGEDGAREEDCRSLLSFAVTDGESVVCTRYVSSMTDEAASLFFSSGTSWKEHQYSRKAGGGGGEEPEQKDYVMERRDKGSDIVYPRKPGGE